MLIEFKAPEQTEKGTSSIFTKQCTTVHKLNGSAGTPTHIMLPQHNSVNVPKVSENHTLNVSYHKFPAKSPLTQHKTTK